MLSAEAKRMLSIVLHRRSEGKLATIPTAAFPVRQKAVRGELIDEAAQRETCPSSTRPRPNLRVGRGKMKIAQGRACHIQNLLPNRQIFASLTAAKTRYN